MKAQSSRTSTNFTVRRLNIIQLVVFAIAIIYCLPSLQAIVRSVGQPGGPGNYPYVLSQPQLFRYFLNSATVSTGTIVLTVTFASMAGFAFSKLRFPGQRLVYYTLLLTLLIPAVTLIVPLFVVVHQIGLYDTYLGLILPLAAFAVPFQTVIVKNYMDSLPSELLDAARIDGCGNFDVFWRVVMPLTQPIQAIVVTLVFLQSWNNYVLPLVLLKDSRMYTVPVAAVNWATRGTNITAGERRWDLMFAMLLLLSLPTVIIFVFLQRWLMQGIVQGAIKG